ncbi:hypothetical protein WJX73_004392 [Symbiochloris irregularis]|uniref:Uncharacterized protein n=1 Tax=Symbiochloris irregularis TaxID=706552 RepID=A0AAW1PWF8_9CHLO
MQILGDWRQRAGAAPAQGTRPRLYRVHLLGCKQSSWRDRDYVPVKNVYFGSAIKSMAVELETNLRNSIKKDFWGRVLRFIQSNIGGRCSKRRAQRLAEQAWRDPTAGDDPFLAVLRDLIPKNKAPAGGWQQPNWPHEKVQALVSAPSGYTFHSELSTDGYSVSLVFERQVPRKQHTGPPPPPPPIRLSDYEEPWGIDPGCNDIFVGTRLETRFRDKQTYKDNTVRFSREWYFQEGHITTSNVKAAKWQQDPTYASIINGLPTSLKSCTPANLESYTRLHDAQSCPSMNFAHQRYVLNAAAFSSP